MIHQAQPSNRVSIILERTYDHSIKQPEPGLWQGESEELEHLTLSPMPNERPSSLKFSEHSVIIC